MNPSRLSFMAASLTRACAAAALLLGALDFTAHAAGPRVVPQGKLPADERLRALKDLNGYFPFTPPKNKAEWAKRSEEVRRQILVSQGIWPLPVRSPLNPVIHGKVDRGDYTVERVYFESHPGFFVTGSLYRPKGTTGKAPGILCPHGHWNDGRFYDQSNKVRSEIVAGAERFEEGGSSPLQARCVQLARMGCVVFHYDMLGYADSTQLSFELVHRFAKQRPEMNTLENWGFFSTQAEAHLQSVMGLQTWNSIRALDFLETLPDVDPTRLAVTGASGGGTQTMLIAAIDPRVSVSVPAVMVSTAMQGGCTCENSSVLRVDTGNVEFAALYAPKPMAVTTANDWTKEMSTKGYPELQQLYAFMGAKGNVNIIHGEHFPHNYNYVSRAGMYAWMNKHLKLGLKEPIVEEDYKRLTKEEMTVWDDAHPQPPGGDDFERKLVRYLTQESDRQLREAQATYEQYRHTIGGGFETVIGHSLMTIGETDFEMADKIDRGSHLQMQGLLRNKTHGAELPIVFLHPKDWNGRTVIWVDGDGKAALWQGEGLRPEVEKLLKAGCTVVGVDLLYQGELQRGAEKLKKTGKVENPREFAGYTFGYNHPVFASRVHDVLSVIAYVKGSDKGVKEIDLIGVNGSGTIAAAARALSGEAVARAAIDTGGFRFGKLLDFYDPDFLPGGAKYDDVPGLLALNAPGALWVTGENAKGLEIARTVYEAARAPKAVEAGQGDVAAAVDWLLK